MLWSGACHHGIATAGGASGACRVCGLDKAAAPPDDCAAAEAGGCCCPHVRLLVSLDSDANPCGQLLLQVIGRADRLPWLGISEATAATAAAEAMPQQQEQKQQQQQQQQQQEALTGRAARAPAAARAAASAAAVRLAGAALCDALSVALAGGRGREVGRNARLLRFEGVSGAAAAEQAAKSAEGWTRQVAAAEMAARRNPLLAHAVGFEQLLTCQETGQWGGDSESGGAVSVWSLAAEDFLPHLVLLVCPPANGGAGAALADATAAAAACGLGTRALLVLLGGSCTLAAACYPLARGHGAAEAAPALLQEARRRFGRGRR
jgi:hypothetical protein